MDNVMGADQSKKGEPAPTNEQTASASKSYLPSWLSKPVPATTLVTGAAPRLGPNGKPIVSISQNEGQVGQTGTIGGSRKKKMKRVKRNKTNKYKKYKK
jgi:hypothetical protein